MDNRLDSKYISNAIDELVDILGIKESSDWGKLEKMLCDKETKKCLEAIASQLGLPIEINLSFVPKDYKPSFSYSQSDDSNRFQSRELARTDSRGRGIEAITAQVSIPNNLPFYGTPALTRFPINVKLSENCNEQRDTLMAVMAHELSHVLLHSLLHPQRNNEFYTDLTAMILGFSAIIERGRTVEKVTTTGNVTKTQTTTYGYLSDEQFIFAHKRINSLLIDRRLLKKDLERQISRLRRECYYSKRSLLQFNEFLKYMDKHHDRNINQMDARRIALFHQACYTDELEKMVKQSEKFLSDVIYYCKHLVHYTRHTANLLEQTTLSATNLRNKFSALNDDLRVLGRYISLPHKIKTIIRVKKA